MNIQYGCTYWGSENLAPKDFIEKAIKTGYDGVELFLQPTTKLTDDFLKAIEDIRKEKPDFFYILLQLSFPAKHDVYEYIKAMNENLRFLSGLEPLFINSHTGKDHFSFDDNCRIIEAAMNFSTQNDIRILHETHRGRFSFHAASLLPYLKQFPEIELVGDFSHFCNVSESMLEDQQHILDQIIPHVSHIHARVGFEQGPQVNDPSAPEWQGHVNTFMNWWDRVIDHKKKSGLELLTITPEFGPVPYMPVTPLTQQPLSDQWDNNSHMLKKLKNHF